MNKSPVFLVVTEVNMFKYMNIEYSPICATLAERSKVNLEHRYLPVVTLSFV